MKPIRFSLFSFVLLMSFWSANSVAAARTQCGDAKDVQLCLEDWSKTLLSSEGNSIRAKYEETILNVLDKESIDRRFIVEEPMQSRFKFIFDMEAPYLNIGISKGKCFPQGSDKQIKRSNVRQIENAMKTVSQFLAYYHGTQLGSKSSGIIDIKRVQFCDKDRLENGDDFYYADKTLYVGLNVDSPYVMMTDTAEELAEKWNTGKWFIKKEWGLIEDWWIGPGARAFFTYKNLEGPEVAVGDLIAGTPVLWTLLNPLSRIPQLETKYQLVKAMGRKLTLDLTLDRGWNEERTRNFVRNEVLSIAEDYEITGAEREVLYDIEYSEGVDEVIAFYTIWRNELREASIFTDFLDLSILRKLNKGKEQLKEGENFLASAYFDLRQISCDNQVVNSKNIKTFLDLNGGFMEDVISPLMERKVPLPETSTVSEEESDVTYEIDLDIVNRVTRGSGRSKSTIDKGYRLKYTSSKPSMVTVIGQQVEGDNCINLVDNVETQVSGLPDEVQILKAIIPSLRHDDLMALAFKRALVKYNMILESRLR